MLKKLLVAPAAALFALVLFAPAPAEAGARFGVYVGGAPGYYSCPADPYAYPYALPAYCYQYYGYPYGEVYPYFNFGFGGHRHFRGGHEFHGGHDFDHGFHGGGHERGEHRR